MMEKPFLAAYQGSLFADALAMPVHWYYDRDALDRDYGPIDRFHAPKPKHPDSILWRSRYEPPTPEADILHGQAIYWGQREVHYHQFLPAGENTLNFQLARELYRQVVDRGGYDPPQWLERYIELMRDPDFHQDTYVEEYHRNFFLRLAQGKRPERCGSKDIHIGGLAHVPALLAAGEAVGNLSLAVAREQTRVHVSLTHDDDEVRRAADTLVRMLFVLAEGKSLEEALVLEANGYVGVKQLEIWAARPDREVVGNILTPACYLPESFTAALFLAWKYRQNGFAGVRANAEVGGDNCHRGAVVGALLGASCGIWDKAGKVTKEKA
ncbi:MAG: ADP-ribosylglycohydrolase family protein [Opitutales bacterium]|nr:ADP-ribosylglycohydrolase family protein [Opitutales bacterium]